MTKNKNSKQYNRLSKHQQMEKFVLGIYGSPRRGGNSDKLLDAVLEGVMEGGVATRALVVRELNIAPCMECDFCSKEGRCSISDDMPRVREEMHSATAIVLAAPVFFHGLPGHLKCLIDRTQVEWVRKHKLKMLNEPFGKRLVRRGYFVSVGATKGKKVFEGVIRTVKYSFDTMNLIYSGGLFFRGMDGKDSVRDHATALRDAKEFGLRIAREIESSAPE